MRSRGGSSCLRCLAGAQVYDATRRGNVNGSSDLTLEQWLELIQMFRGRCAYCWEPAECIDHVHPISRGGLTTKDNVLPACASCNGRKGERTVQEFEQDLWPCPDCKQSLPRDQFHWRRDDRGRGCFIRNHSGRCRACTAGYWRAYRAQRLAEGRPHP